MPCCAWAQASHHLRTQALVDEVVEQLKAEGRKPVGIPVRTCWTACMKGLLGVLVTFCFAQTTRPEDQMRLAIGAT